MVQSQYQLRKLIREIMLTTEDKGDEPLPWYLFEYFGSVLLDEAGYPGDQDNLLLKVKSEMENEEGWEFD